MKVKRQALIAILLLMLATIIIYTIQPKEVAFEQLQIEDLDAEIQSAIHQTHEQGIYFFVKDQTIILYSNLSKSGLYTYPYAEITSKSNKLFVKVESELAPSDEMVKENLIGRVDLKKLPEVIEASFLGGKVESKIIRLDH